MNREDINYRLVVDSTPALVFSARPDGYVDYFNQRWFDCLGVPLTALEGWGWTSFIHPDDREEHLRRWRTSMSDGQPAVSQSRVADAKGEYRWMLHRTEPLRDEAGNVIRWFGTGIDIEELKRAQREVEELKERLYKENAASSCRVGSINFRRGSIIRRSGPKSRCKRFRRAQRRSEISSRRTRPP